MAKVKGLTDVYPGVVDLYREGDFALIRVCNGLFVRRLWDWKPREAREASRAPFNVVNGIEDLVNAEPLQHGMADLEDLRAWALRYRSTRNHYGSDPQPCCGEPFDRRLIAWGLATFTSPDIALVLRLLAHNNGRCLSLSFGVDHVFVMSMAHGIDVGRDPMPWRPWPSLREMRP